MSHARQLPLYQAAMALAIHLEGAVRRFSRYHKYTLGSDLRRVSQRLCSLVMRAAQCGAAKRPQALDELVLAVEDMKILLALSQQTRAFACFNDFATAAELAVSLGKQSGGWRRRVRPDASIHTSPQGDMR